MRKHILAIAAATIMLPTFALADGGEHNKYHEAEGERSHKSGQFDFQGPVDLTSVAELKAISFGEEDVIVEGNIIRQLANGDYIFTDGKDEITVEMEKRVKLDQAVNDKTKLRLYGEYEGWDKVLEVEHVKVLNNQ